MIITITMNPSIDLTIDVNGLKVDDAIHMEGIHRDPGGKGVNVSRVVNTLGGPTIAYGFIGGDEGGNFSLLLAKEGVLNSFLAIEDETRINIIINDLKEKTQTRIHARGPRVTLEDLYKLQQQVRRISNPSTTQQYLVLGGSLPQGLPITAYRDIIEEAKEVGMRTVLDSDDEYLKHGIKGGPFMIKPNTYELERLTGRELMGKPIPAFVDAAKEVLDKGVEVVAITRGPREALLITNELVLKAKPPQVKVNSPVGAGDSFVAGFLLAMVRNYGFKEALRWGIAAGAAATVSPSTQLVKRAEFEKLLPKIAVEEAKGE